MKGLRTLSTPLDDLVRWCASCSITPREVFALTPAQQAARSHRIPVPPLGRQDLFFLMCVIVKSGWRGGGYTGLMGRRILIRACCLQPLCTWPIQERIWSVGGGGSEERLFVTLLGDPWSSSLKPSPGASGASCWRKRSRSAATAGATTPAELLAHIQAGFIGPMQRCRERSTSLFHRRSRLRADNRPSSTDVNGVKPSFLAKMPKVVQMTR